MRVRTAILTSFLLALAGCAACDTVPDTAITDCNAQVVPGGAATDILFVVDDSGSMSEEQDELAANLGAFVDQLLASPVKLDVHLGVTNTSVEDYVVAYGTTTVYRLTNPNTGNPTGFPGPAGTPYPQGTLVAIEQLDPSGVGTAGHFMWGKAYDDPSHLTSVFGGPRMLASSTLDGTALARDFKANVLQGTWGSSREQPLSAMRRALEKAALGGTNQGFLRSGARLAVVILTDEDDCSGPLNGTVTTDSACHSSSNWDLLDPLPDFVDYLDTTLGGEPPIVALIAGFDAQGVVSLCRGASFGTSTSAAALPRRLDDFVGELDAAHAGRTIRASICQGFGPTLLGIASRIIPQTMPLERSPEDWRMMAVALQRPGSTVPCRMELAGSAGASSADVLYHPAPPGGLPSLSFQNGCTLGFGDRVDLRIVCAR